MQMCLWRPCVCGWDRGCMLSILWCVSESNALYLLTCFSGIYVIQLLYGANFILPREMSCFLTHNTLYWDPTEICSQTFDGGRLEIFRNWRSVKTLKTPWVFVSFSPSVAVLFFFSYPQTHLSDWEDFSCTDSLLSPSACSQARVNKTSDENKNVF